MNDQLPRDKNDCTKNMADVISLIPLGWTKEKIRKKLKINIHAVVAAIRQLYNLFHVRSFAELTRIAIQLLYYVETRQW